jgi:hypothetical protein
LITAVIFFFAIVFSPYIGVMMSKTMPVLATSSSEARRLTTLLPKQVLEKLNFFYL